MGEAEQSKMISKKASSPHTAVMQLNQTAFLATDVKKDVIFKVGENVKHNFGTSEL